MFYQTSDNVAKKMPEVCTSSIHDLNLNPHGGEFLRSQTQIRKDILEVKASPNYLYGSSSRDDRRGAAGE